MQSGQRNLLGDDAAKVFNENTATKAEEITIVHDINEEIPFKVLQHNNEFKIILGNQIVSAKVFDNLQMAKDYINTKPWELITSLSAYIVEQFNFYQNEQRELKEFAQETQENN